MSLSVEALEFLRNKGLSIDDVIEFAHLSKKRSAGAERQKRYRERKRSVTGDVTGDGDSVTGDPALSRPPNENSNPPTHTHPDVTSCAREEPISHVAAWLEWREANPFPRPWWAKRPVWRDFLANRKRKNLPNTATAHSKFLNDITRLTNDEWPPGRLLEHASGKGWGAIYEPEGYANGRSNVTHLRPGISAGADKRSSLARAIDEGLEYLGGGP